MRAVCLVMLAGCVHSTISTTPQDLAPLRTQPTADVEVYDDAPDRLSERHVETVSRDTRVRAAGAETTVGDLLARCSGLGCPQTLVLREPRRADADKIVKAIALTALATAPVLGTCALACDEKWAHASQGALVAEAGIAIGTAIVAAGAATVIVIYGWASHQH